MDQANILKEWVQQQEAQKKGLRIISVASGKGGSGKTSFAVNAAIELAKLGQRVLILDADFGLANVDVLMGYPINYNLYHVIKGEMKLEDIIIEGHYGVKFISGGSGVQELLALSQNDIDKLVNALLQLEKIADIILIDTSAGVGQNVLRMVRAASEMLVVTTPEPTSIMDAYALVKTVFYGKSGEMPLVRLVINRAETKREAELTMESFARIVKKYLEFDIVKFGFVPNDPNVPRSVKAQLPMVMGYPESPASKAYSQLARALVDQSEEAAPKTGIRQFFERFIQSRIKPGKDSFDAEGFVEGHDFTGGADDSGGESTAEQSVVREAEAGENSPEESAGTADGAPLDAKGQQSGEKASESEAVK